MSSQVASGLARKLKKVLETRTDSPDLLASLGALSAIYKENSVHSRRHLRLSIEQRGLGINEEFLAASEAAQQALDVVEAEVKSLAHCCERIASALQSCTVSTGDMVVATEQLKTQLEAVEKRQQLVTSFLRNYQLSQAEIRALRDEEMSEAFFAALSRVHEIHSNCKMLLRTHHQRAGLELMDVMAVYQEGAYERLCRWVQSECRTLGDGETPEVSPLLRTAARSLRERPVLFRYCAEEVANTRHNALFRRFIAALTRGGPGGMPRPIEVHAHDPLRYVGDMLAWLHQALASEKEVASALFSSREVQNETSSKRFSAAEEQQPAATAGGAGGGGGGVDELSAGGKSAKGEGGGKEAAADDAFDADMAAVLDRIFEGVCRPFKVRVEQILTTSPGITLLFKLTNLLRFYLHTFAELLGPNAALAATLGDLLSACHSSFSSMLTARGEKLLRFPTDVPADLSPPPALMDGISLLVELLEAHGRMMVAEGTSKPDFEPILDAIITPLLEMCERAVHFSRDATSALLPSDNHHSAAPSSSLLRSATTGPLVASGAAFGMRRASVGAAGVAAGRDVATEMPQGSKLIFLINCLSTLHQGLSPHEAAGEATLTALTAGIEQHMESLVSLEVTAVLLRCQLAQKVDIIRQHSPAMGPLSKRNETSAASLVESVKSLFSLLSGVDGLSPLPEFVTLQMPKLRTTACSRVALGVAEAYNVIFDAVCDPTNEYSDVRSIARHTPEQMRTILGI